MELHAYNYYTTEFAEEEDSSIPVSRYPCMPSLVALQQMRNRLHLARLGKKLMKWTALATGRELRKLADEIKATYKNFKEDMCDAFMLLARARYFNSNLNKMVLENIDHKAVVTVAASMGTVSGVKVLQLDVVESGDQAYAHLGIERGGNAINEAKICWLVLLKRLVLMIQQRFNYRQVETANKAATKRKNILIKIIIPRIRKSIQYILAELEEMAREELYRIKKVKQNRIKDKEKKVHSEPGNKCVICGYTAPVIPKKQRSLRIPVKSVEAEIGKSHSNVEHIQSLSQEASVKFEIPADKPLNPMDFIFMRETSIDIRLDSLHKQLFEVISMSGKLISNHFTNNDLITFSKTCENCKLTMKNIFKTEQLTKSIDGHFEKKLETLKFSLKEIIDMMRVFRDTSFLSPSVEQFIRTCKNVDDKIQTRLTKVDPRPVNETVQNQLKELLTYIDNVDKITKDITEEESFIAVVKNEIDNLKEHIIDLEHLASQVKQQSMSSASLENFIVACKNFKGKVEEYKKRDENLCTEDCLDKLINYIQDTIELSRDIKENGLMSENMENTYNIKEIIDFKEKMRNDEVDQSEILTELQCNINDIMDLIYKSKGESLITNVDDYIECCEKAKAKIDMYEQFPVETNYEGLMLYSTCSETCTCDISDISTNDVCDKCLELPKEEINNDCLFTPSCNFCQGILKKESSEEMLCESCNQISAAAGSGLPINVSKEQSQEHVCDICKENYGNSVKDYEIPLGEADTVSFDDDFNYFEKKVHKITKVKRTQQMDGTIHEVKETILVETHEQENIKTSENEFDFDDVSYESSLDDSKKVTKHVGICIICNQYRPDFIIIPRRVQSELIHRPSILDGPSMRQCVSEFSIQCGSVLSLQTSSLNSRKSEVVLVCIIHRILRVF